MGAVVFALFFVPLLIICRGMVELWIYLEERKENQRAIPNDKIIKLDRYRRQQPDVSLKNKSERI